MSEVKDKIKYYIQTKVTELRQYQGQWFVHFLGSHESLGLGFDEPDMKVGDAIIITIERSNAKPSQPPV